MERLPEKIASIVLFSTASTLAWENSQHLATLQLVSLPNDVWETSAEIPYWWPVTTQIWVVLLIGWIKFPRGTINQKHYPDMGSDASSVWNSALVSQTSFGGETSGSVAKRRLFSQATSTPFQICACVLACRWCSPQEAVTVHLDLTRLRVHLPDSLPKTQTNFNIYHLS